METLNKLVFDTLEFIKAHHISDDVDIDPRQIKRLYHIQRALWLRNEYNKPGRTIDPNVIQDLGCVPLEIADAAECCDIELDCNVLRTEQLPTLIELHDRTGITRVGPINRLEVPFSFVTYDRAVYAGNGKYNQNAIFAFLRNGRIYLISKNPIYKLITHINVQGLFEDPEEVSRFSHCSGESCYTNDSKYPLNEWMVPYIKEQIYKELGISSRLPSDQSNDAKDDVNK